MTSKTKSVVLSLGLAALLSGCGHPSNISKEADHGIANAKMESMPDSMADSPVHTIVMPHDEPVFPPGPGRDEFVDRVRRLPFTAIHHDAATIFADYMAGRSQQNERRLRCTYF